ncbi:tyrosine-type recombinase/integrase [Proteus mirabilis]
MTIKALEGGRYKVDIRPQGRAGKRVQRIFSKKADAISFERSILLTANNQEWKAETRDFRSLSELIDIWWKFEGRNLTWGNKRKVDLQRIIREMGDPAIYQITPKFLAVYRSDKLHSGVKASTINRDLALVMGVFTKLSNIGEFHSKNPIKEISPLKQIKPEMTYLTQNEIDALLNSFKDDYWRITILCLSTGARWGEATNLRAENVLNGKVTFTKTKNGKHRTVPISLDVMSMIKTKESGLLFDVDYTIYRDTLKNIKPDLPKGQSVHVLRHTFASHFMMNGGNILTLQKIMGHANIQQTMVYAHLAPDYLKDAITYNPLSETSTFYPQGG